MRILITGATGSLGKALITRLHGAHQVTGIHSKLVPNAPDNLIRYNLLNDYNNDFHYIIQNVEPDAIIHCAGISSPRDKDCYLENMRIADNVARSSALYKDINPNLRFINISSILVYGNVVNEKIDESSQTYPQSPYALSKAHGEDLLSYHLEDVAHLRLATLASPTPTQGLLADLFARVARNPDKLELWGRSPGSRKPYVFLGDVVNLVSALVESKGGIYGSFVQNVCPSDNISVLEIARIIKQYSGYKGNFSWLRTDEPDYYIKCGSHYSQNWAACSTSKEAIIEACKIRYSK